MEPGAALHWHRGEKKNQTPFLRAWLLPPAPPRSYLYIFGEESQAQLVHKLQFLGGPHAQLGFSGWIRLPGKPEPGASQRGAPGLTAGTQETGSTEGGWAGHRREAGLLLATGIQKWGTGGDRLCFPYCCSPCVSRKMFLVRQWFKQRTQRGRLFFLPPAKQLIFDFSPDSN